jgi:hypothetical protein
LFVLVEGVAELLVVGGASQSTRQAAVCLGRSASYHR